ncbi:MAG: oligosaccharide flippase family protein, partial [Alistipes sp.]
SVTSVVSSVQNVTFPALANIASDERKFAESYRQVVMVVTFVMFPAMLGLIAVAEDLFTVLVGAKWLPAIPYLRVFCLTGLFYPVTMIAYNVLKVKSDGKIIVRLEIVKKILMTAILALTLFYSVLAVVWGLVAMSCIEMCLNIGVARRFVTLSLQRLLRTVLPVALVTAAMFAATWGVGQLIGDPLVRLVAEIATGAVTYVALSAAFRLEAFREVTTMLRRQLKRS